MLKCPYEAQVSLLMTDDDEIHRLNLLHRRIDRAYGCAFLSGFGLPCSGFL